MLVLVWGRERWFGVAGPLRRAVVEEVVGWEVESTAQHGGRKQELFGRFQAPHVKLFIVL